MTRASRSLPGHVSTPVGGQLEVSLEVPNLGQAAVFYSRIFAACPAAVERRMVWFAVPDSALCIELRETLTPTAIRLRLSTGPDRLHRVTAELGRSGVSVARTGLTRDGSPRAISFRDPGRNHWELYTSIVQSASPPDVHRSFARWWRSLSRRARAEWSASASVEARFNEQVAHNQALLRRYG